jgi:hypothetical protein
MREFKLNGVHAWIIQSKQCKISKDNYLSSLKSTSKTISPFLIILTMTHMMEFVSGAAFVSLTWDVIWNLVTTTFLSNLHMVRMIYMSIQTCEMAGFWCWWILNLQALWGSSFLVEACWKVETASVVLSYYTIQQNKGNPTKASGMLRI